MAGLESSPIKLYQHKVRVRLFQDMIPLEEEQNGKYWNAGVDHHYGHCLNHFRCWQASSDWGKHGKGDPKLQKCDRARKDRCDLQRSRRNLRKEVKRQKGLSPI